MSDLSDWNVVIFFARNEERPSFLCGNYRTYSYIDKMSEGQIYYSLLYAIEEQSAIAGAARNQDTGDVFAVTAKGMVFFPLDKYLLAENVRKEDLERLGMDSYEQYITSLLWLKRRSRWWKKYPGSHCANCDSIAVILHHRTYVRIGNELDTDLCPLCVECHINIHTKLKKKRHIERSRLLADVLCDLWEGPFDTFIDRRLSWKYYSWMLFNEEAMESEERWELQSDYESLDNDLMTAFSKDS